MEQKKQTNGQLQRRLKNALVHIDKGTIELTLAYTALDKILNKSPKHVPADQ